MDREEAQTLETLIELQKRYPDNRFINETYMQFAYTTKMSRLHKDTGIIIYVPQDSEEKISVDVCNKLGIEALLDVKYREKDERWGFHRDIKQRAGTLLRWAVPMSVAALWFLASTGVALSVNSVFIGALCLSFLFIAASAYLLTQAVFKQHDFVVFKTTPKIHDPQNPYLRPDLDELVIKRTIADSLSDQSGSVEISIAEVSSLVGTSVGLLWCNAVVLAGVAFYVLKCLAI